MRTDDLVVGRGRHSRAERESLTRDKLLSAAIDVFGRYGFDGATTRALADAANVNLQAIPYYFAGKEGLYIAAAEHIASLIHAHVAELRNRVCARLDEIEGNSSPVSTGEARALLSEILQTMATLFIGRQSEPWARFLIREQMAPTEAFTRVYGSVMRPMLEMIGKLIAILLGEDAASEHVRLRALALLGSVMIFRIAHAAVLAQLDWKSIGDRETEIIRGLAIELVASVSKQGSVK